MDFYQTRTCRSLFMMIRWYLEVNFVKIKFHFFRILLINALSFSAGKHYLHPVVKVLFRLAGVEKRDGYAFVGDGVNNVLVCD